MLFALVYLDRSSINLLCHADRLRGTYEYPMSKETILKELSDIVLSYLSRWSYKNMVRQMRKKQSLSVEVAADIKKQIRAEKLLPGAQVQTEAQLCEKYGVSRTVIREAIVRLCSEGLLTPRQGLGVFVSSDLSIARFEVDWDSIQTMPETVALLELRLAIEVESAGLCAIRRTKADAKSIRQCMEKTHSKSSGTNRTKYQYDFDLHLAIARATKNSYLYQLLLFLKPIVVKSIKLSSIIDADAKSDFDEINDEQHEAIVEAIEAQDEQRARQSMRLHLISSWSMFASWPHRLNSMEKSKANP
jgi:GntR family transcriptional regulator, transcriptional repressor for pyruvate dehydrogenase complex